MGKVREPKPKSTSTDTRKKPSKTASSNSPHPRRTARSPSSAPAPDPGADTAAANGYLCSSARARAPEFHVRPRRGVRPSASSAVATFLSDSPCSRSSRARARTACSLGSGTSSPLCAFHPKPGAPYAYPPCSALRRRAACAAMLRRSCQVGPSGLGHWAVGGRVPTGTTVPLEIRNSDSRSKRYLIVIAVHGLLRHR